VTSRDDAVPPAKQLELASALHAPVFDAPIRHLEITTAPQTYNPLLLRALATVGTGPAQRGGPIGYAA